LKKAVEGGHNQSFGKTVSLARIGPGAVVGALESFTQIPDPGVHTAVTPCRLHQLTYTSIEELENKNPGLILKLFKMMSLLSARRQQSTIDQLVTLQSIMTSQAPTKPISRRTAAAIKNACKVIG
jgi:CRP-like cAMP-binding protein